MAAMAIEDGGLIGHVTLSVPIVFASESLFFAGIAAAVGAYHYHHGERSSRDRVLTVATGSVAAACFVAATIVPLFIGPGSLSRPSSSARLSFLAPVEGARIAGDPATIHVRLQLVGGTIVPFTSVHLVPNEGHVHLYLDGRLALMTGLEGDIRASPGTHALTAEFVAVDHGPFRPRVTASVTFSVHT
jgi:hypothetical protein